ncbi:MAG: CinA family protein [Humibacillus sp.]
MDAPRPVGAVGSVDAVDAVGAELGVDVAARLVQLLTRLHETVACAESLTAGLVTARLADVPGASVVLVGGIVTYAPRLKVELLGVPAGLIEAVGTVDPAVAAAMAQGVRARLGSTWGLATTGVAGPGPAEGKAAGTVHVAVAGPSGTARLTLRLTGERAQVRAATVREVLLLALREVGATRATPAPPTGAGGTVGRGSPESARSTERCSTGPTA